MNRMKFLPLHFVKFNKKTISLKYLTSGNWKQNYILQIAKEVSWNQIKYPHEQLKISGLKIKPVQNILYT